MLKHVCYNLSRRLVQLTPYRGKLKHFRTPHITHYATNVNLLSAEQCSQFERFRLQHVQMVSKTSSLSNKKTSNGKQNIHFQN